MQDHSAAHGVAGTASCRPAAQESDGHRKAIDLLRQWCALSELERRAFLAVTHELNLSSDLVERSTLELSKDFQALASCAEAQASRTDRIIAIASTLDVDGTTVSMEAALDAVNSTLSKAIETILFVSKHAMRMVYTLEDVAREVASAEQCSGQIALINQQARYLALNAAIEAARSGSSAGAFHVIAEEMRQLSQATEKTAQEVGDRIAAVKQGVGRGHAVLHEIATLDLSQNIMAKERMDSLLAGIAAQHALFNEVLAQSAIATAGMAGTVGKLITGIQFQDRTKQHLAQVVAALGVLRDSSWTLRSATEADFPGAIAHDVDRGVLDRIAGAQTLSAVKGRILGELMNSGTQSSGAESLPAAPHGDIELF